jgi:DNA-binding CsgD family transcriptional regulator
MGNRELTATELAEWLGGDLDTALDDVEVPAWLVDDRGVIRWANRKAIDTFGPPEGRHLMDAVGGESRGRAGAELTGAVLGTKPVINFTATVLDKQGNRIPAEVHAAALRGGGRVVGLFGLTSLGEPLPETQTSDLTPRQFEVLQLLARGHSTDQIAGELHLSKKTVRNHVRGILRALGVHSRLEAIVEARRQGLVD